MPLFLKIVIKDFESETRDQRELGVVQELGHEILVIAKGPTNAVKRIKGFAVQERTTRPLGDASFLNHLNRIISIVLWTKHVRTVKADFISCHDLSALLIGWLSTWGMLHIKKPLLIYDAHEFEVGKNPYKNKKQFSTMLIKYLESFLMRKADISIMVNSSIADKVQKIHNLRSRPYVIRNMAYRWNVNSKKCLEVRNRICKMLQLPTSTFLLMYHGGILPNRGIEMLIQASAKIEDTAVIILGNGDSTYMDELRKLAADAGYAHKILFLEAVAISELWEYVGAADVGSVLIQDVCQNHYLSLPNKLFENIQAGTPVIASNFPEIRNIVEGYSIGLCCEPSDINDVIRAIDQIKKNQKLYNDFKNNLETNKNILCWESEKSFLYELYSKTFMSHHAIKTAIGDSHGQN